MSNIFMKTLFIPRCIVCGKPADADNLCNECARRLEKCRIPPDKQPLEKGVEWVDGIYASYYYRDRARDALLRAKFKNPASFLASVVKDVSGDIKPALDNNIHRIMRVPYHKSKLYESEFDLPCETGKRLRKEIDIPFITPVEKVRKTAKQHDLPLAQRKANLIDAFKVTGDVKDKNILIIDDVMTTGITLSAVAFQLKLAGRAKVYRWVYTFNTMDKGENSYGDK